jgi:hypothetical protein
VTDAGLVWAIGPITDGIQPNSLNWRDEANIGPIRFLFIIVLSPSDARQLYLNLQLFWSCRKGRVSEQEKEEFQFNYHPLLLVNLEAEKHKDLSKYQPPMLGAGVS